MKTFSAKKDEVPGDWYVVDADGKTLGRLASEVAMRLRGNQGKWLLRQVLYRYVPRGLIERPKMGFGIPVGQWLRGPLRDWAEDLLSRHALEDSGLLDADVVRDAWRRHLSGNRNMATEIWTILMFQAWHRHWMTEASQAA